MDNDKCISSIFKNDDIMNCLPPKCYDEPTCYGKTKNDILVRPSPSSIALSAITSLLFTMCGVATCLWMCFKYRECMHICAAVTSPPVTRDRTAARQSTNMPMQSSIVPATPDLPYPVAPTEEKDLPPSYDSLFGSSGNANSVTTASPIGTNSNAR